MGWGEGDGDFLDRLSGCWESAMSTCSSIILGEEMTIDVAAVDEGEGGHDATAGGVFRWGMGRGEGDVDDDAAAWCGETALPGWKYIRENSVCCSSVWCTGGLTLVLFCSTT